MLRHLADDTDFESPALAPRTVLCHGCFDLIHLGHIRHLQEAKAQGDKLVVSVTSDAHVRKGAGRPWFTAEQRVEALRALAFVDDAFINDAPDAVDAIARIKPSVYVKGMDYAGIKDATLDREIAEVETHGGRFHVTSSEKWSSSRIINGERLSDDTVSYLETARQRGFRDKIMAAFDRADQLAVTFVGETIIDEYRYVSPLGKPAKECIIATVETRDREEFSGGVVAAAKHAEWRKASVLTHDQAVIRKTRFVDPAFTRKLFEVYSDREIELNPQQRAMFGMALREAVIASDVMVALDFGHGLFGQDERSTLIGAKFLAVNAQTNTGNFGFNPITKHTSADYVCIDEPEARLATGMQSEPMPWVLKELTRRIVCPNFIVTRGRIGCLAHRAGKSSEIPAFATNGVDTMGAGDAFLAATAPLLAAGLELDAAAFVGNVAGAIKVGIVGHRAHVTRADLVQTVESLLK